MDAETRATVKNPSPRPDLIGAYNTQSWWRLLLDTKGSMLKEISARVMVVLVFAVAVTAADRLWMGLSIPNVAHVIVGGFLSLLLVFRTNASYDRFWEGRRQWGAIINESRNLGRQCASSMRGDPAAVRATLNWAIELPWAIMHTLRRTEWISHNLSDDDAASVRAAPHLPTAIAVQISSCLEDARRRRLISDLSHVAMDQNVGLLVDYYGACERIHKTPLPFAYVVHLRRALVIYLVTLPFALLSSFQWGTIPATFLIAYILFGIEEIGVEIEDPFGTDINDLPVENYCKGIQTVLTDLIDRSERWHAALEANDGSVPLDEEEREDRESTVSG